MIQLAGAFVHLQKNRLKPSLALFRLADKNLRLYPATHEHLDVSAVLRLIEHWSDALTKDGFTVNPLQQQPAPQVNLMKQSSFQKGSLLIATRNRHKLQEIRQMLGDGWNYLNLTDFPGAPEVVEDEPTFAGNAKKKSVELARWLMASPGNLEKTPFPLIVLADDSGLEVDALDGAPGVYSARFAALDSGKPGNSPDSENSAKLLRSLARIPMGKRSARFRCVIAITAIVSKKAVEAEWPVALFDGQCEGHIAGEPSGDSGFGYDPLFIPNGFEKSFAELGEDIKNRISHRSAALAKLKLFFVGAS